MRSVILLALALVAALPAPVRAERLFTSGFEWQSVGANVEWSALFTAAPAIDTTTKRSGAASLRVASMSSGAAEGLTQQLSSASDAGPYRCRAYVRFATFPSAANTFLNIGPGSARIASVKVTNTGVLQLFDDAAQVGSNSSALALNTWYRIELLAQRDATTPNAGADTVDLRIEGVSVASSTTASLSQALSRFNIGGNLNGEANTAGDWYFDDVACNNSAGSSQTSFPGSGRVVHLVPNAAGEFAEASATGAATPHEALDETTPDDATSYVTFTTDSASWSAATRLMVNVTNSSTAGIDSHDSVTLVQVRTRIANIDGTGTSTLVFGIQTQNTGTKTEATVGDNTTPWATDDDTAPQTPKLTAYVNPQGAAAWTTTALDSLQIGARSSDATPDILLSAIVAVVEFVDGAAPSGLAFVQSAISATIPFDVPTGGVGTATFASPVSAGDYIVVLIATASSRTVSSVAFDGGGAFAVCTDPGATTADTGVSVSARAWAYCGVASGPGTTVTVTVSSATTAEGIIVITEWSGQNATTPVEDVVVATTSPANTAHATGSVTTTAASSALIGFIWGTTGTYTIDTDYTAFASATTTFTTSGYDLVNATTAGFDVTTAATETSVQLLVAITPGAVASSSIDGLLLRGVGAN